MNSAHISFTIDKLLEEIEKLKGEIRDVKSKIMTLSVRREVESQQLQSKSEDDILLDTKDVRAILRVSHNTLQAIVNSGKLKQIRLNGHNIRFSKKGLEEYITGLI